MLPNYSRLSCSSYNSVGNLAHVHFASNLFGLPLKTEENPRGLFTDHELYMILTIIFSALFFDMDPTRSFQNNRAAHAVAQQLGSVAEATVKADTGNGLLSGIMGSFRSHDNAIREHGTAAIKRLQESGLNASEIAWSQILPTVVSMVPNQGQIFTQIVEYYTSLEGKKHLPEINRLAKTDSKDSDEKLFRYCLEAIRIDGTFGSYRQAQSNVIVDDSGKQVEIKAGDKIFASFVQANHDPSIFPEPSEVLLDRPLVSYLNHGQGPNTALGHEASKLAMVSMLRVVGRLENLRRAPGPQGQIKKVLQEGGYYAYLRPDESAYFAFPMCKFSSLSRGSFNSANCFIQLSNCTGTAISPLRSVLLPALKKFSQSAKSKYFEGI